MRNTESGCEPSPCAEAAFCHSGFTRNGLSPNGSGELTTPSRTRMHAHTNMISYTSSCGPKHPRPCVVLRGIATMRGGQQPSRETTLHRNCGVWLEPTGRHAQAAFAANAKVCKTRTSKRVCLPRSAINATSTTAQTRTASLALRLLVFSPKPGSRCGRGDGSRPHMLGTSEAWSLLPTRR